MRTLVLVALLGLSSCGVMRDAGTALCDAQEQTAAALVKGGDAIGLFGAAPLAVDLVNTGLEFFCAVFDAAISAPAALGTEIGLPPLGEATDAEATDDPGS